MKALKLALLVMLAGCAAHDPQPQAPALGQPHTDGPARLAAGPAGAAAGSNGDTVEFTDHGSPVMLLDPAAITQRTAIRELSVAEPHHDQPVGYRAVSLAAVLDSVYGAKWHQAPVVVFKGADGFEAGIPVARLTTLHADLAFAFSDGSPFTTHDHKHGDALIPLGPWRLIWEDAPLDGPREGANWPYQVISIDLEDAPAPGR